MADAGFWTERRVETWFTNFVVLCFAVMMASGFAATEDSARQGFYVTMTFVGFAGISVAMAGSFVAEERGWM